MKKIFVSLIFAWVVLGGKIHFSLENYSLFYNFEYKDNPYYDGRTFFGDWIQGYMFFNINKKVKAELGGILWRFYGGDRKFLPYLSVVYRPAPWLIFRFGNLRKFHKLHRAIYFDTFYYEKPSERGFQITGKNENLGFDAWINWEREMRKLVQENFEVGTKAWAEGKTLFGQVQYHYVHYGGEYLEHHVGPQDDMVFMFRGGFKIGNFPLGRLKLSSSFFASYFIPDRWLGEKRKGRGMEIETSLKGKYGEIFFSQWKGSNFYHQDGDPLYQGNDLKWLGYRKNVKLKNFDFSLVLTSGWVDGSWVPYQKIQIIWKKEF